MFVLSCTVANAFYRPGGSFDGKPYEPKNILQVSFRKPLKDEGFKLIQMDIPLPPPWGDCSEFIGKSIQLPVDVNSGDRGITCRVLPDAKKPSLPQKA